jgi:hypothetical protein
MKYVTRIGKSNIPTVTNTKINMTIKTASTYPINVKLGPTSAPKENTWFHF